MLRKALLAGLLAVSSVPAVAAGAPYTTADTTIGTLVDDAAAKAVLEKHMPGFSTNPQLEMAKAMTLKQIQGFAPDMIKDETLAKIDADLAKLPAK
ncbi:hypothetical protein OKA06_01300 [Novosphingobium sp. MW5]|nr:hypothetical protein [Novosphingobium sp. MW5]